MSVDIAIGVQVYRAMQGYLTRSDGLIFWKVFDMMKWNGITFACNYAHISEWVRNYEGLSGLAPTRTKLLSDVCLLV